MADSLLSVSLWRDLAAAEATRAAQEAAAAELGDGVGLRLGFLGVALGGAAGRDGLQVAHELGRRLVAVLAGLLHHLDDDPVDGAADERVLHARGRDRLGKML